MCLRCVLGGTPVFVHVKAAINVILIIHIHLFALVACLRCNVVCKGCIKIMQVVAVPCPLDKSLQVSSVIIAEMPHFLTVGISLQLLSAGAPWRSAHASSFSAKHAGRCAALHAHDLVRAGL